MTLLTVKRPRWFCRLFHKHDRVVIEGRYHKLCTQCHKAWPE